jgi:hypothetical protein
MVAVARMIGWRRDVAALPVLYMPDVFVTLRS